MANVNINNLHLNSVERNYCSTTKDRFQIKPDAKDINSLHLEEL